MARDALLALLMTGMAGCLAGASDNDADAGPTEVQQRAQFFTEITEVVAGGPVATVAPAPTTCSSIDRTWFSQPETFVVRICAGGPCRDVERAVDALVDCVSPCLAGSVTVSMCLAYAPGFAPEYVTQPTAAPDVMSRY